MYCVNRAPIKPERPSLTECDLHEYIDGAFSLKLLSLFIGIYLAVFILL